MPKSPDPTPQIPFQFPIDERDLQHIEYTTMHGPRSANRATPDLPQYDRDPDSPWQETPRGYLIQSIKLPEHCSDPTDPPSITLFDGTTTTQLSRRAGLWEHHETQISLDQGAYRTNQRHILDKWVNDQTHLALDAAADVFPNRAAHDIIMVSRSNLDSMDYCQAIPTDSSLGELTCARDKVRESEGVMSFSDRDLLNVLIEERFDQLQLPENRIEIRDPRTNEVLTHYTKESTVASLLNLANDYTAGLSYCTGSMTYADLQKLDRWTGGLPAYWQHHGFKTADEFATSCRQFEQSSSITIFPEGKRAEGLLLTRQSPLSDLEAAYDNSCNRSYKYDPSRLARLPANKDALLSHWIKEKEKEKERLPEAKVSPTLLPRRRPRKSLDRLPDHFPTGRDSTARDSGPSRDSGPDRDLTR